MELRALHRQGWSKSELSREFGLNRRTVARYIEAEEPPAYRQRPYPAGLSPDQRALVQRRLGVCPAIRATTLYREVREIGYTGSYPSFARQIRTLRVKEPREPEIRFETSAGHQTQADWAEIGAWPLGEELVELKVLVGVLGYSRMPALRFAVDKTRATTLRLMPQIHDDLGGAPGEVLTDRDPAFVIGQSCDGRPIFAPDWVDQCFCLGIHPKACKPYRAKTKGKVERMIREVKEDFLCWLTGQGLPPHPTLADYHAAGRRWALEIVGARTHRTTKRVVRQAWAEERGLLRPIPARLLVQSEGLQVVANVIDLSAVKAAGALVEHRGLGAYQQVLR
jgi:transposase